MLETYRQNILVQRIPALVRNGKTAEAVKFCQGMPVNQQYGAQLALVSTQVGQGDYAAAKQTIQNVPEAIRNDAWSALWRRQLERGDFAAARESRQAMPTALASHRKTTMQYCEALVRAGRLDEAKAAALELAGQPQELTAFNMVATEMIKRGDESGGAAVREKISPALRERAAKEFRSLLVTAAATAGDAQRAVRHFGELPADERTYPPCLAIVGVLYRTGDNAGARR